MHISDKNTLNEYYFNREENERQNKNKKQALINFTFKVSIVFLYL